MTQESFDNFVCPQCRGSLKADAGALTCGACRARWPVTDGVPDFRPVRDRYWGEVPEELMDRLLAACRQKGWHEAVKEFFKERDPGYYEYLTDKRRANWSYLVSLPRTARILDAGCGWGALSFPLAERFGAVYGLDIVPQRCAFVHTRGEQDHQPGVIPLCGPMTRLPFADGFFDGVVLNGVLEWIPSTEDGDPEEVQAAALKEACRVLKPGGILYLAIENRWAAINFLGFRDTHSGLRFAPLLPRPLANLYSRIARRKDFREYTYTYREHKRMLRRAGFREPCFYAPLPTYRRFYYFLPIDDSRRVRFFLETLVSSRNRLQRFFVTVVQVLRAYGLVKYFVPDYSILAQKGTAAAGTAAAGTAAAGTAAAASPVSCGTLLHQGEERVTQFLFEPGASDPATVLKVYQDEQADRWAKMCDVMRGVYDHADPVLACSVPRILGSWKEGGRFLVRESFVAGTSLQRRAERRGPFWKKEFILHLEAVTAWVSAFHRASVVGSFVFEEENVRRLLGDLAAHVPAGTFGCVPRRTSVPAVIRHRDLRPANLLSTPQGLRVVDWDRFAMRGLPLLDLMEFILRYVHARCMWQEEGMHLKPAVFRRYLGLVYRRASALSRAVRAAVGRYGEAMGLDTQQQQLLLACWTHYMFCPRPGVELCVFERIVREGAA